MHYHRPGSMLVATAVIYRVKLVSKQVVYRVAPCTGARQLNTVGGRRLSALKLKVSSSTFSPSLYS